jgi:hypothetical protein
VFANLAREYAQKSKPGPLGWGLGMRLTTSCCINDNGEQPKDVGIIIGQPYSNLRGGFCH